MTYRTLQRGGSPYRVNTPTDDPANWSRRGLGFVGADQGAPYDDVGPSALCGDKPYCDFQQSYWSGDDVYVFRFQAMIPKPDTFLGAYPYVDAYIQAMPVGNRNQNIIGVALQKVAPSSPLYQAEIVFTDAGGVHLNADTSATTIANMNKALVKSGNPFVAINGHYLYLNNPDKTHPTIGMQKWTSLPPIWSYQRFASTGDGRTEAWQNGDGVYLGSAVSPQSQVKPRSQPEIGAPPATVADEAKKLSSLLGNPSSSTALLVGGVALTGSVLYLVFGRKKS